MFENHLLSWTLLGLFLLFLFYTLVVIKEEKASFKDSARELNFHQFKFLIPSWWSLTDSQDSHIQFERTDTRYDWKARLEFEPRLKENQTIEEDIKERIDSFQAIFDLDSSDILMPQDFKNRRMVQRGHLEMVRIEGTATLKGIERAYLDIFLVRDLTRKETLFSYSHSSVLNGVVEGPYFEEMMLSMDYLEPENS